MAQVWFDTTFYVNFGNGASTGYYAVGTRPQNAAVAAGALCRQATTSAVGSERVFVCVVAGTTQNVADATWTTSRGAKTIDGTVTWQECTGVAGLNGDATNTPTWATAKALGTPFLGAVIKRNNGASYQICTTAGTMGASEPSFSDTAGGTVSDGTSSWTSLGVVGNFTPGGKAPFARLATVVNLTWIPTSAVNSYNIFVGDNHAETQSTAMNITYANTIFMVSVLCHNHSGSYPPTASDLTTGASCVTTGNTQLTIQVGGFYFRGLTFYGSPNGATSTAYILIKNAVNNYIHFELCSFQMNNSVANASIQIGDTSLGGNAGFIIWNNCTIMFGDATQRISINFTQFHWKNTSPILFTGSTVPNCLIITQAPNAISDVLFEALDLSQINTSFINTTPNGQILVKDCKLNASLTATGVSPTVPGINLQFLRSDSGATAYKTSRYQYEGSEITETLVTRVGGAIDQNGQAQSRKITTFTTATWLRPFRAEPYAIWNATVGANVTATVCGLINSALPLPNNDDIWIEVEYLGSSSSPLGTIVNTTKANVFSANAALASDTSGWDNTAAARANSHAYSPGDVLKVASNPGRIFFCTVGGTSAGSEPGGFATAVDGGTVTDSGATFRAGCRFKLATTLSSPQPGLAEFIYVRVRIAKPSVTYYIDPKIVLT